MKEIRPVIKHEPTRAIVESTVAKLNTMADKELDKLVSINPNDYTYY